MFSNRFAVVALCACCVPAFAVRIELVPVGGSDNSILVNPGDIVLVEVHMSDWAPESLRGGQVEINTDSLTSGPIGSLALLDVDTNGDDICDSGLEPYCPTCPEGEFQAVGLGGIFCDSCRPDHICGNGDALNAFNTSSLALGSICVSDAADPGATRYLGTMVFAVSNEADGTFTLTLYEEGDPDSNNGGSFAISAIGTLIEPIELVNATIVVTSGCTSNSDCADGDICTRDLCVDGECQYNEAMWADVAPYDTGDGQIGLMDVLAVLDAFAGQSPAQP